MKKQKSEPKAEKINFDTGEVTAIGLDVLNKVVVNESIRANGSLRIQQDFSNCPTMAEQHTAHLTNLNYLIDRYKPDELGAYLAARSQYRQEIVGHNFASEPSMQEAKNIAYRSRSAFEALPDNLKNQFKSHLEFLKFADIPSNAQKLIDLQILTPKQLQSILISDSQISLSPSPQSPPNSSPQSPDSQTTLTPPPSN